MTICNFATQVEQLNSYLGRVPGLINSPKAIKTTKEIMPFDEAELTQLLLRMCQAAWQDQYSLTQGNIPQDLGSLLEVLETIEACHKNKKTPRKPNGGELGENGKPDKKKCKVSFREERVPKKAHSAESCDLCKKHGGAHTIHNTGDCRKYKKDGFFKKG